MQIEVDIKHTKDVFQVWICIERSIRKYIEFDSRKTQNQVSFIGSLNLLMRFVYEIARLPD